MSEPEPGRDPEPVDETDESAKLYVSDPDDYAKTRKLKALNDAKSTVREVRQDRPAKATEKEWEGLNRRLSQAVASYGHELLPLLEEAEEAGTIGDGDYYTKRGKRDVRTFLFTDGRIENEAGDDWEIPGPARSMSIYRHLQSLERKIGLGPSLEEQADDEWEIQT